MTAAPPAPARLDVLDAVRAVAALMVCFHHTGSAVFAPPLVFYGYTGVYIFFALSGYLLFRPYVAALFAGTPPPAAGAFYARRALRILPPYLVCLGLYTAARYATGEKMPDAESLLAHALLVFNYLPGVDFFGVNAVFWTLALEAQFYVLLPPLAWLAARATRGQSPALRAGVAAGGFVAIGVIGRPIEAALAPALYGPDSQIVYRSVFSYLDLFGYGMAVAVLERAGRLPRGAVAVAGWAGLALLLVLAANNLAPAGGFWMGERDPGDALPFPPMVGVGAAAGLAVALAPRVARWPG